MVQIRDTPFTRLAYDKSALPAHLRSRLGARNYARGVTIPPPPREGAGYLVYILVDEVSAYHDRPHQGATPAPDHDGLMVWDADFESYQAVAGDMRGRLKPILFPIPEPAPTHFGTPGPNSGYSSWFWGQPFFWSDHLSGTRTRQPLPAEFSINNFPRRREIIPDPGSPLGYILDPRYSSAGIFVGPVNTRLSDPIPPQGVIVIASMSASLLCDGLPIPQDWDLTFPVGSGARWFNPSSSCYENGLFLDDRNGISLKSFAEARISNWFQRYWTLFPHERWLAGLAGLYALALEAWGP